MLGSAIIKDSCIDASSYAAPFAMSPHYSMDWLLYFPFAAEM